MKEWRNERKSIILVVICVLGCFALFTFILNLLFKTQSSFWIFKAEWSAGEALTYLAGVFGAVGTISLGFVAFKQNDKLHKMEIQNYIANFSSMILINEITIEPGAILPGNPSDISNQIIIEKSLNNSSLKFGYNFTITAERIGEAIPSYIRIRECNLIFGDRAGQNISVSLFGVEYDSQYSRISIHRGRVVMFKMTFITNETNIQAIKEALKEGAYKVAVEMIFDIVTDKNVVTRCKCHSYCVDNPNTEELSWISSDPMVFFLGHSILKDNSIRVTGE